MYINFKIKYKKFFWLLLGFMLSCIFVDKVHAAPVFENYDFNSFYFNFNNITYDKSQLFSVINEQLQSKNKSLEDFQYITVTVPSAPQKELGDVRSEIRIYLQNIIPTSYYSGSGFNDWFWDNSYTSSSFPQQYFRITISFVNGKISSSVVTAYNSSQISAPYVYSGNSPSNTAKVYSNYDFSVIPNTNTSPTYYTKFYYDSNMLYTGPSYLQGYKKIDLTTNDKYVMISDVTSGSIFIPTQAFNDYGGRLSYYDNDLNSQPYTSYIQDYTKMPDGQFIRQDFNLDNYTGADFMMFSKYIYLEGEDNISYSIWVPDTSYDSQVTITPNSQGGNNFDFTYKDSNGDIQNGQVQSEDLSQDSPLLGNIFEDFSSNTFGLTSIITAPLSLIQSLSSTSCTPLNLPLPFVGGTLTLPCMYDFYSNTFGILFTLYQTITFGIVAYWVMVRIFNMIKDFKNPDHDEIEVVDL